MLNLKLKYKLPFVYSPYKLYALFFGLTIILNLNSMETTLDRYSMVYLKNFGSNLTLTYQTRSGDKKILDLASSSPDRLLPLDILLNISSLVINDPIADISYDLTSQIRQLVGETRENQDVLITVKKENDVPEINIEKVSEIERPLAQEEQKEERKTEIPTFANLEDIYFKTSRKAQEDLIDFLNFNNVGPFVLRETLMREIEREPILTSEFINSLNEDVLSRKYKEREFRWLDDLTSLLQKTQEDLESLEQSLGKFSLEKIKDVKTLLIMFLRDLYFQTNIEFRELFNIFISTLRGKQELTKQDINDMINWINKVLEQNNLLVYDALPWQLKEYAQPIIEERRESIFYPSSEYQFLGIRDISDDEPEEREDQPEFIESPREQIGEIEEGLIDSLTKLRDKLESLKKEYFK